MSRVARSATLGDRFRSLTEVLQQRFPSISATILAIWAGFSAITALIPPLRPLLRPAGMAISENTILLLPNLAYATFLALLAAALSTRKRAGWRVLMVFLLVNLADATGEFASRHRSTFAVVFAIVALALAALARLGFTTRVRSRSLLKAGIVFAMCLAVSVGIGFVLVELFPGTLPGSERLLWSINRATGGYIGFRAFAGTPDDWVGDVLGFLGSLSLLSAFAVVFQSQALQAFLREPEERAIRALLDEYGRADSLGYFATRRDKAAIFSDDGRAAVLYRVEIGVCLASGDPIGDPASWGSAIARWQQYADAHGWSQAVLGTSERAAHVYERAGLSALQLGDEAIIDVNVFNQTRSRLGPIRRAVRRIERQGITARVRRHHQVPPEDMEQVRDLAERWRGDEPERGFSMALGRLGDPADGDCLLVEALAPDGTILALLSFVPWGTSGISLDLMRRNPDAPNGVIEYLVSNLAEHGSEHRVSQISLNFAVLRSAFEEGARIGAGPILRAWRKVLLVLSKYWQLEALYRSNVKFEPTWVPRFLCYDDARMLVRIGIASGIAEGFVNVPEWTHTRRRLTPDALPEARADEIVAAMREEHELRARGHRPPEQVRVRMARLAEMAAAGVDAYPASHGRPSSVVTALDAADGTAVTVAGRVVGLRNHGGILFAEVRDWTGTVQCVIESGTDVQPSLQTFDARCDRGDLVELAGVLGHTKTGERSVFVSSWRMLAKCLHPLPGRVNGTLAPELRVRQRHVDLALNDEARVLLRRRATVIRQLRECLHDQGYLEVETPILHTVHGGANARPFATYSNAYDLPLSLRIAPELYLKRLCVGGVDKVYELGRVFRNEGADRTHNPEFTALEAYDAFGDYTTMRHLCRELIIAAAIAAHGEPVLVGNADGGSSERYDIGGEWPVVTVHEAVSAAVGVEVTWETPLEQWQEIACRHGIAVAEDRTADQLVLELYETLVEPNTMHPTFFADFPTSVCPLTRSRDDIPQLAERWDLVAFGMEIATAYSELNDPVEQRRRLEQQSLLAAGGDPEAMVVDEQFLQAMEFGMPPTGGIGIGVDRLLMLLSGQSIRTTLAFPLVRPGTATDGS
ncbi:bifunctional lysylphosphatidylglycerol synthetase/lysine--tRNA ligase LysX [Nocardioides ginsengisoli]|uniref:Lysine--tRNA ligase n=1 Tax=Nocardioides ginsengisoli TaxID=363868 RepID=A0ABW3W1P2_9ACTN